MDVEADGPIPGDFSMVALGAVIIEPSLQKTFYARLHPISEKWMPDSLKICGFSREQTLRFERPQSVLRHFAQWLSVAGGKIFISFPIMDSIGNMSTGIFITFWGLILSGIAQLTSYRFFWGSRKTCTASLNILKRRVMGTTLWKML